jgi:hypothetical protein
MWTRRSRRRPSRRPGGRRGAQALLYSTSRPPAQSVSGRPRRSLWRRWQMRLRALWRWGAAKLFRRFFGRAETPAPGPGQARVHLLPDQRQHRL